MFSKIITFYYLAALHCISLIILSYRGHKLKSFRIYTPIVHYLWLVLSHHLLWPLYIPWQNIAIESKYHPTNKCWVKKKRRGGSGKPSIEGYSITPYLHQQQFFLSKWQRNKLLNSWELGPCSAPVWTEHVISLPLPSSTLFLKVKGLMRHEATLLQGTNRQQCNRLTSKTTGGPLLEILSTSQWPSRGQRQPCKSWEAGLLFLKLIKTEY